MRKSRFRRHRYEQPAEAKARTGGGNGRAGHHRPGHGGRAFGAGVVGGGDVPESVALRLWSRASVSQNVTGRPPRSLRSRTVRKTLNLLRSLRACGQGRGCHRQGWNIPARVGTRPPGQAPGRDSLRLAHARYGPREGRSRDGVRRPRVMRWRQRRRRRRQGVKLRRSISMACKGVPFWHPLFVGARTALGPTSCPRGPDAASALGLGGDQFPADLDDGMPRGGDQPHGGATSRADCPRRGDRPPGVRTFYARSLSATSAAPSITSTHWSWLKYIRDLPGAPGRMNRTRSGFTQTSF
jgi:hypothetical protein